MACRPLITEDGKVFGFACGPKREQPKYVCQTCWKRRSERQCDYPTAPGKTCDKHLCSTCAVRVGPDKDHCPDHQRETEKEA